LQQCLALLNQHTVLRACLQGKKIAEQFNIKQDGYREIVQFYITLVKNILVYMAEIAVYFSGILIKQHFGLNAEPAAQSDFSKPTGVVAISELILERFTIYLNDIGAGFGADMKLGQYGLGKQ
jgi:hypothetical protein